MTRLYVGVTSLIAEQYYTIQNVMVSYPRAYIDYADNFTFGFPQFF